MSSAIAAAAKSTSAGTALSTTTAAATAATALKMKFLAEKSRITIEAIRTRKRLNARTTEEVDSKKHQSSHFSFVYCRQNVQ